MSIVGTQEWHLEKVIPLPNLHSAMRFSVYFVIVSRKRAELILRNSRLLRLSGLMKLSERDFRRLPRLRYMCRVLDLCYNKIRGNKKSRLRRYLSFYYHSTPCWRNLVITSSCGEKSDMILNLLILVSILNNVKNLYFRLHMRTQSILQIKMPITVNFYFLNNSILNYNICRLQYGIYIYHIVV